MATQTTDPTPAQLTAEALRDTARKTRVGILEHWRKYRAERRRRVIVQWLRRTASREHDTDPICRRREALLQIRAAAVRTDLLEIAAMLERAHTPTPRASRSSTSCSQTVATARSTTRRSTSPAAPHPEPSSLRTSGRRGRAELCGGVVERNAEEGVTWIIRSEDKTSTFCIYDAPTPEAIRKTAARNELPVDRITQVRVLDPYFYTGEVA